MGAAITTAILIDTDRDGTFATRITNDAFANTIESVMVKEPMTAHRH